jgi:CBS domain-containing protein
MKRGEEKTVGEIVKGRPLYVAQKDISVLEAVRYMVEHNVGALPVLDGERLVGIFSERDVLTRVVAQELNPASVQVAQVMTTRLATMEKDNTYSQALLIMDHLHIRHLPVMNDGQLMGCISIRDLRTVDIEAKAEEIEFMDDYVRKMESVM